MVRSVRRPNPQDAKRRPVSTLLRAPPKSRIEKRLNGLGSETISTLLQVGSSATNKQ